MKTTLRKTLSILITLALMFALSGCGTLKKAAALEQYEMGEDAVPSITSVVGEREVTGVESSTSGGTQTKKFTYLSGTVFDDLLAYIDRLTQDGWLVTQGYDLNAVPGSGELGINAAQEGKYLLVAFSYDAAGYVITITKGNGTIE